MATIYNRSNTTIDTTLHTYNSLASGRWIRFDTPFPCNNNERYSSNDDHATLLLPRRLQQRQQHFPPRTVASQHHRYIANSS
mmetsp:Transcript_7386/g.13291  ORF Transcript_7386/g.13291 Transcript_7386/m.13291 type:complete len:82 (-) Transcript_7386:36-281(-)